MSKPVCLITGVGGGTGGAIAKKFGRSGYRVAMLARTPAYIGELEQQIEGSKAYVSDVGDLDAFTATIDRVKTEMGTPEVAIHNAVRGGFSRFLDADPEDLEKNFRVNTTSLLYLARALAPDMIKAGKGAIVVTGNTSSLRGVPTYSVFAATKAAQRILAQSLARDLGPKGIHVGYVTIDAAIDAPWLTPDIRPDWLKIPEDWPYEREDFFADTGAIADEVYHIAHQHKTTWSFDHIIRPFAEKW